MSMNLFPKLVSSCDPTETDRLRRLEEALRHFYSRADQVAYWSRLEANAIWSPSTHPFHIVIRDAISSGDTVVDLGCGSAHPARNLSPSVKYVGVDCSAQQTAANRAALPSSEFVCADVCGTALAGGRFDWAISFFALEHCVWPAQLLREAVRLVRDGGHVGILCPQFRPGVMNSMWCGRTAIQSFWRKLREGRWLDAMAHALGQRCIWPLWLKWMDRHAGKFSILLRPRCLQLPISEYASDTDAVYWSSRVEVEEELASLGCAIVTKEVARMEIPDDLILCVARKIG